MTDKTYTVEVVYTEVRYLTVTAKTAADAKASVLSSHGGTRPSGELRRVVRRVTVDR